MRVLTVLVLLLASNMAFSEQVVMSSSTRLKSGDYVFGFVEVNGAGSGDFRPAVILCNPEAAKKDYLETLSAGRWLTVSLSTNEKNQVSSAKAISYEVTSGLQKKVTVFCSQ